MRDQDSAALLAAGLRLYLGMRMSVWRARAHTRHTATRPGPFKAVGGGRLIFVNNGLVIHEAATHGICVPVDNCLGLALTRLHCISIHYTIYSA